MSERIVVGEVTGSREVFRSDGALLLEAIETHWHLEAAIEIDFENRVIASASFFDESFGLLALQHPVGELQRRLRPINLCPADRGLLNDVIDRRTRERADRLGERTPAAS